MAKVMIRCLVCKRYVPLVQKGYRIYCPECGREITYSENSISAKPIESTTIKGLITGQGVL